MPFEGNPKAGQPNTQLLNFLFAREDAKQRQRMDLAKAEQAAEKQDFERTLKLAKEQRDIQAHKIKVANDLATLRGSTNENVSALSERQKTADTLGEQALKRATPALQEGFNQSEFRDPQTTEVDPTSGKSFADILGENDPALLREEVSSGTIEGVRSRATSIRNQFQPAIDAQIAITAGQLSQATGQDREFWEQQLRNETVLSGATTDRHTAEEEVRLRERKILEEEDTIRRPTERIKHRRTEMHKLQKLTAKMEPGDRRDLLVKHLQDLSAAAEADLTKHQPAGFFAERNKTDDQLRTYLTRLDSTRVLKRLLTISEVSENTLGTAAGVSEFVNNFTALIEQSTGKSFDAAHRDMVTQVLADPNLTPTEKDDVVALMIAGTNPKTQQAISTGKLAQVQLAWTLNYLFNQSGRVNQKQLDSILQSTQFMGGLLSKELAQSRILSSLRMIEAGLERDRRLIARRDPSVVFNPDTGEPWDFTPRIRGLNATRFTASPSSPPPAGGPQVAPEEFQNMTPEFMDKLLDLEGGK